MSDDIIIIIPTVATRGILPPAWVPWYCAVAVFLLQCQCSSTKINVHTANSPAIGPMLVRADLDIVSKHASLIPMQASSLASRQAACRSSLTDQSDLSQSLTMDLLCLCASISTCMHVMSPRSDYRCYDVALLCFSNLSHY